MLDERAPFIFFEDARVQCAERGRLYRNPREIVEALRPDQISEALAELRLATRSGLHIAGFLSYEAGYALEPRLAPLSAAPAADAPPLLWFGLFDGYEEIDSDALLPAAAGGWASGAASLIDWQDYQDAVVRVKTHIEAGDIYQANLTFPAEVRTAGHPLAIYAGLRRRARAGHGGVVFTGAHWLLSCSPELFFTVEAGQIVTRPMKGTALRYPDPRADAASARDLSQDSKQRAENLMIVDLLRNDLSRVSQPGSVKVPSLFEVETYPTVHQMTSTVTARLREDVDAIDILEAIFPCGSVTGAPKIRAMEIIADVERSPRAAYTGSMGWIAPGGKSSFNVAIRTLSLKDGEEKAILGLGSAIVADSEPQAEWRECIAKGAFVADAKGRFDLLETMRFDQRDGIAELERHLVRLKRSAAQLDFPFDRHSLRNDLQAATFRLREPSMIRVKISRSGAVAIEARPAPPIPAQPVKVKLRPLPVASADFRLRHKISDRAFYDDARTASGAFEILFEDKEGFLTEGSFTNIFVPDGDRLLTPPLSRGLLPGILRESLIELGEATEADLTAAHLVQDFYVGNIVRGLVKARLVG